MKSTTFNLICATLVGIGVACWINASEPPVRKPYPKATPPPPPSPVYTPSKERAPTAKEIEQAARDHDAMLAKVIERTLVAKDPRQRETAFAFLLPELLQSDPHRVVAMVARQQPGEVRNVLLEEVARLWIARDRDAAIDWMKSLDGREQLAVARLAMSSIAAFDPPRAIYVADQFGIGRDDGSLEHLVQMWAEEQPEDAGRWIAAQPDGPRTEQLRARIDQVLASHVEREEAD